MKPVIRVENLAKQYRIGTNRKQYKTFRETLTAAAATPFRKMRRLLGNDRNGGICADKTDSSDTFWALKDVSFEVQPGEVVGIIGRNGAGKSTLLKVLSRITEPTTGRIALRGHVGSLLEVGTGFHPELTGRENIFMNGSILGMTRREINRKLDEIIDFSGIQQFLDTPVKRYSSGMYVRLAFSVAAHLEPEILIIDEVLAVGDAEFQRRCLGKMEGIAREGRTILFVSHNMAAVETLCTRAVLVAHGTVTADGPTASVISKFIQGIDQNDSCKEFGGLANQRLGTGEVRIRRAELCTMDGNSSATIPEDEGFRVRIQLETYKSFQNGTLLVILLDSNGHRFCEINSADSTGKGFDFTVGIPTTIDCDVSKTNLVPGVYGIKLAMVHKETRARIDLPIQTLTFRVVPKNNNQFNAVSNANVLIRLPSKWSQQTPGL